MTGNASTPPSGAAPDRLRVSVLGPVRVWAGDRELSLGAGRRRTVLAVLAAHANRPVELGELTVAVWGAAPPATATGSIYTYVSGLRRILGRHRTALVSLPSGYLLELGPGALDGERFGVLCDEAAAANDGGDPALAATRLDEALGLWHGEAYAGLSGDRIEGERAHLAGRRLAAVELRARIAMDLGDDDLVADLARLVRAHPLHEPLHELLMLALDRAGRPADALAAFREARDTLVVELGVEPGAALRRLHRQILAGAVPASPAPARVRPGPMDEPLAGRRAELELLRDLLRQTATGAGAAVWIDGEPGIGKTELLTRAFADAPRYGCRLVRAVAEPPDRDEPLRVVRRALGLDALPGQGPALASERVLAAVRQACAAQPLVLVVDDLHRADQASLRLWARLAAATRRMPLLLVAAARPEPHGHDLARVRHQVRAQQGHTVVLRPLPAGDIELLVAATVGAPLGPHLRAILPCAGGNPRSAREMAASLVGRGAVRVGDGRADIDDSAVVDPPESLLTAVRATLAALTGETREILRRAALLGPEFVVDDLVKVTGSAPFGLLANLDEALAANVVVEAGADLAFRHPLLRQAFHDDIPAAARARLRRHTAQALAAAGSPVTRVAVQLAAEDEPTVDAWLVEWLVAHHVEAAKRVPEIADDLFRRALASTLPRPEQRATLLAAAVRLGFRQGLSSKAEAREALRLVTDPAVRAEMRLLLAAMHNRGGDPGEAMAVLAGGEQDRDLPEVARSRWRWCQVALRRGDLTDLDEADRRARRAYDEAVAAALPYEAAFALQTGWMTNSIRRDHEQALEHVDRALELMHDQPAPSGMYFDEPALSGMYFDLLDNRLFTLQNLDRLDEAEQTLREAALFAIRHRLPAPLQAASAVQYFWSGRWDDATAQISAVTDDAPGSTLLGRRERGALTMLMHGVAALIAARRDDAGLARACLAESDTFAATMGERENSDFLLVARSLIAEQQNRPGAALDLLTPLLTPGYAPIMLRHQWLPDTVRLALETGRRDVADRAAAICRDEAAKETRPARAFAAAARCRALLSGDPVPALDAAAHYREAGRPPELAGALEDAAVLLAAARRPHEASRHGAEAAGLYDLLGARWDLARLRRRLDDVGIDAVPGSRLELG